MANPFNPYEAPMPWQQRRLLEAQALAQQQAMLEEQANPQRLVRSGVGGNAAPFPMQPPPGPDIAAPSAPGLDAILNEYLTQWDAGPDPRAGRGLPPALAQQGYQEEQFGKYRTPTTPGTPPSEMERTNMLDALAAYRADFGGPPLAGGPDPKFEPREIGTLGQDAGPGAYHPRILPPEIQQLIAQNQGQKLEAMDPKERAALNLEGKIPQYHQTEEEHNALMNAMVDENRTVKIIRNWPGGRTQITNARWFRDKHGNVDAAEFQPRSFKNSVLAAQADAYRSQAGVNRAEEEYKRELMAAKMPEIEAKKLISEMKNDPGPWADQSFAVVELLAGVGGGPEGAPTDLNQFMANIFTAVGISDWLALPDQKGSPVMSKASMKLMVERKLIDYLDKFDGSFESSQHAANLEQMFGIDVSKLKADYDEATQKTGVGGAAVMPAMFWNLLKGRR